ncbi:hypothetical protein BGW38_007929 [Lunasporangiospora selenospora]|uniref:Uncharacterized protein n=1 Tax=Lunasporangiospora selenospora TaxID=979761 RepID=A0A9P6KGM5_9FUNG|nr:hypothetical protein BGW38_007929 [Lunasporangiospora selenospora]
MSEYQLQPQQHEISRSPSSAYLKRKPVKSTNGKSNVAAMNSKPSSPHPQRQQSDQSKASIQPSQTSQSYSRGGGSSATLSDATGKGMGMAMTESTNDVRPRRSPNSSSVFQQSQAELLTKLEELASSKHTTAPSENPQYSQNLSQSQRQLRHHRNQAQDGTRTPTFQPTKAPRANVSDSMRSRALSSGHGQGHDVQFATQGSGLMSSHKMLSSSSSTGSLTSQSIPAAGHVHDRHREPRRRVNSAQFKTPSAVEMAELAQVVVANATPPKVQNKFRKRLTGTTFIPPNGQSSNAVVLSAAAPRAGVPEQPSDLDLRQRYDAAIRDAKTWEKKYSAAQNQIHYERELWEEKYSQLESAFRTLERSRAEVNVEKMNTLLDTVQQLQQSNEVFRKQLQDAGIEPDPTPAADFHSELLLVGDRMDRTFLEENDMMREKSLVTNQAIAHLSSEINNSAIAISQTINYVQLRYLTQLLDAAEHVSSQKRTRAMSNSFLSDMLSRGVKKAGPLQAKNTISMATQTPPTIVTGLQQNLQPQQLLMLLNPSEQRLLLEQAVAMGLCDSSGNVSLPQGDAKLGKNFSFSSPFLNLAGLSNKSQSSSKEIQYRLKAGSMMALDDRSQWIQYRQGIPPMVVQNLRGSPTSPVSVDLVATSKVRPIPKFQYASPTSSQMRIFVPDVPQSKTGSIVSGSRTGSLREGAGNSEGDGAPTVPKPERQLFRSASDVSLLASGRQPQSSSRRSSRQFTQANSSTSTSEAPQRSTSQQYLSPEMAIAYNNSNPPNS